MDFHCLVLLFISLGEFKTLLSFFYSSFPAHLSQLQVVEINKHIYLLPSAPS